MSRTTQECPRCGLEFRAKAKPKAKPAKGRTGYLCTFNTVYPSEACIHKEATK